MNDLMTKSFTSYVDLKKEAMRDLEAGPDYDLELSKSNTTMDQNLGLFLEEAENVKKEMGTIREILVRLQESNEESKAMHKPEALKLLRAKINNNIMAVLKKARAIRSQLEEMDRANAANKRLSGCKEGTPIYRTRIAVTNGLRKKLKEVMMEFQGLRQKMMTEYKETVGRRYFTVTGEYPDEEVIEKIISDNNGGEEFLTHAIQEHGRGKVLETVVEIQDRYDTAKEIEKSLLELHQIFLDMAVMVEAQGEQMDDIEQHVMNASHYVKDGTKELKTAKDHQRSGRKWMCIGIILLLIIILVVFVCIALLFAHVSSEDLPSPDDKAANCVLDFSSFPYLPNGDCIGKEWKVQFWDSLSSTLCCRNALNTFAHALTLHARNTGYIFPVQDQWNRCEGNFSRQETVSASSCGFDDFYYGSTSCSNVSLATMQGLDTFKNATLQCSLLSRSFDLCSNCTEAILRARDEQLASLKKGDDQEKAICGVGVVVGIASNLDESLTDDYYRCLSGLDDLDPGDIKIKKSVAKAIFAIFVAIFTVSMVVILIKYVTRDKRRTIYTPKQFQSKEIPNTWSGLYRFSKVEIENAMNIYNEKKCLGRGSAGQVYKGVLPSGQVVAIKHIHRSSTSDSFTKEVDQLSRIRHPNLVCLFGCCSEGGERYLVYEYCPAGNLAQHLLMKKTLLTWERRVKILRDCAMALRYLHNYIDGCIVHRDIKLTNILLTENLDPKLSDFGLAKMLDIDETKVFTDVKGTIGYMDPEYMSNAKLTCASDVYSFGIVILQLLSGQKVIELDLDARDQLTRKAKDVSMGKRPLTDLEDPRLRGTVNRTVFEAILKVAVLCVAKSSKGRPTIEVLFDELEMAWKNTDAESKANKAVIISDNSTSRTLEV
ncbi:hypothetical protein ACFE04_024663 [Oxalis oulophora]